MTPDDLALSSGLWFLGLCRSADSAGQWRWTRLGPRRTTALMLGLGGTGGAALFALAQNATHIHLAMMLLGVGCAPVLMASYYIFARSFCPGGPLPRWRGAVIGLGSLGNILGAWPLAWASEVYGWRMALVGHGGGSRPWLPRSCGWSSPTRPAPKRPKAPKPACATCCAFVRLWWMMPLLFRQLRASGKGCAGCGLVPI